MRTFSFEAPSRDCDRRSLPLIWRGSHCALPIAQFPEHCPAGNMVQANSPGARRKDSSSSPGGYDDLNSKSPASTNME